MDAEKLSDDELRRRLADCPRPGQLFHHYKTGGTYCVVRAAVREDDQQPQVVYQSLDSGLVFVRPLSEWRELVQYEGRAVKRFRAVEG